MGFEIFCKGEVCNNFIHNAPMLEVAQNNAAVEMALSMLGDKCGMWEELFVKKRGFLVDGLVGLVRPLRPTLYL